jgi:uncharacterized RDD family membrane protein YckC
MPSRYDNPTDMPGYPRRPERDDTDVIGARILAQIIDSIIGIFLMFAIIFVFGFIGAAGAGAGDAPGAGAGIAGFGFIAGFLAIIGYFFLLEGLWDGYTIGKKVMGIKVVKEDGGECGLGASIVRNLLRIIDSFFYYAVGFLVMAMSDKRQRIGDRVAGTVVVRES